MKTRRVYFFLEFQFDEHNGHRDMFLTNHFTRCILDTHKVRVLGNLRNPCLAPTRILITPSLSSDFFLKGLVAQIIIFGQHSRSILGQQIQYLYHVKKRNL